MLSFNDFISSFSTNSSVKNSTVAQYVYENIIWNDDTRITMAELSNANKPAILACAKDIEEYCKATLHCDMDLKDPTIKKTIGRMCAAALAPFGYTKKRQTIFPKNHGCNEFTSGSVFEKTEPGSQQIVKKIVDII